ncbi:MAG: response regulator [Bacillota bacterium]
MSIRKRILSVDDMSTVRKIIKGTVEELGFLIYEAGDGREALSVLERYHENIALILLDWNMPGMNGLEFLKTVKSHPLYKSIPVIMLTTQGQKENIIKAVQAGVSNYLLKPFKNEELTKKIKEVLG